MRSFTAEDYRMCRYADREAVIAWLDEQIPNWRDSWISALHFDPADALEFSYVGYERGTSSPDRGHEIYAAQGSATRPFPWPAGR